MAPDLSTVQIGMDVLDPTGEKIGSISDIIGVQTYRETDSDTMFANPSTGATAEVATTTITSNPPGSQRYLTVDQGGTPGIVGKELYIPFNAVQSVVPGQSVTVNCTKDTCGTLYNKKADVLP
ncbi:MAG: hypothetical protein M3Z66_11425 [Chloroflexota bacterium]|nr:hypothetical protein [Chloroflexota bacterium]